MDTGVTGEVYRDAWGVPHLRAGSALDLAYLQGVNAATDRADQITVERWRSEGRMAEHLGPGELVWDRFARRARLDDTARRCFERLDPGTREWVRRYADGVTSVLGRGRWQPWSSLGVFLVQHILFGTFPHKLWRAHVRDTLGPEHLDLFALEGGSGSNAWLAGGVLAGDPHRVLEVPGIYQQIRLACPEFDLVGLAFPGVPGILHFGHTGSVAWAVTNAMADYQDLYVEDLSSAESWTEQILVRDAEPVEIELFETSRGPVIQVDALGRAGLALRTPTRVSGRLGFEALLPLLRASTVDDVAAALRGWVEPVNSVLVADSAGRALQLTVGLVPRRDDLCRLLPVPGPDERFAWDGTYLEPHCAEIGSSPVVNANDRRPDNAAFGADFAPPHRARRIAALAASTPPERIHADTLAPRLLGLLTPTEGAAEQLRQRLIAWDGRMDAESAVAAVYAAWRSALTRRLAGDPCFAKLHAPAEVDEIFAAWLDPVARVGLSLERIVSRVDSAAAHAAAALEDVVGTTGTWGDTHLLHPVAVLPATAAAVPGPLRLSGDSDCVLATASTPGVSDACRRGPVARYAFDLADRSRSRWVVPFGAHGRPGHPHFADQLAHWAAGELLPIVTDWDLLTKETR